MANWYRSRTSPKFFSKKNSNKCGRKSHPKFWPKWAVAGRLVEQGQKFFRQFSADTWWTSPESFSSIAWFIFDSLLINWFFSGSLVTSMGTLVHLWSKVPLLVTKLSEKNQLISNKSNMNQAIFLTFSAFVYQVSALNQEALKTWRYRLLKNLKTPFFSRYSKFLLIGNWYWSKTSPNFFSKKNSNNYGR